MDVGKNEVIIFSDKLFKPRNFAIMLPNVIYDFNKVILEKYFLWKTKTVILLTVNFKRNPEVSGR